jgi:large subunit ribosomal protein L29
VQAQKAPKAAEFRSFSVEQIDEEVQKSKRALFDLRLKQRTRQEFKPSDKWFHEVKIAQLLTVRREQEVSQGIDRRQSRKLQKQKLIAEGFGRFK